MGHCYRLNSLGHSGCIWSPYDSFSQQSTYPPTVVTIACNQSLPIAPLGFEPRLSSSRVKRVASYTTGHQFNYRAIERNRTADILITSEVLYQLSYNGIGYQSTLWILANHRYPSENALRGSRTLTPEGARS